MDNNFYESGRRPRTRRVSEKEKPKNIMSRIIIIQLVLSLAIVGLLFGVCRAESELSKNIKTFYASFSENDMTTAQILGTFKKVAQFTFAPSTGWDGSFSADEATEKEETTSELQDNSKIENQGETRTDSAGGKVSFSPVSFTAKFEKPIKSNNITSNFGYRISPIANKLSVHSGIDIAAPEGTKISAAWSGVVEKTDYNDVRGNYVVVKHSENLKTTYNHCSELLVQEGMNLRTGETVALVGNTGASTGNHLHLEVILNGIYVDPLQVI